MNHTPDLIRAHEDRMRAIEDRRAEDRQELLAAISRLERTVLEAATRIGQRQAATETKVDELRHDVDRLEDQVAQATNLPPTTAREELAQVPKWVWIIAALLLGESGVDWIQRLQQVAQHMGLVPQ